ncbi:MAG: substrate-binding domain-containing protein [Alphaproteobacteria bacterium]|nr:substrate-binding domain-containing protein [Alphaproteobacteria bacterium]
MVTKIKAFSLGLVALLAISLSHSLPSQADERFITVASTTSTQNSGLFEFMLPVFTKETGIEVRVVAVGTGQAIKLARNGDADVLFVHHKPSEEAFVADGFGIKRFDVMYNDFVIVGPSEDPAGIKGSADVITALKKIADSKTPFASRGDDSGTDKREKSLWKLANIEAGGEWYRETGSGMGATLNTAHGMGAYALTDRATWLAYKNKDGFDVLFEGDKNLFNQYGIIAVSPEKFPHVKIDDAQAFVDWVISKEGQAVIADYKLNGTQLFFPNAPVQGS